MGVVDSFEKVGVWGQSNNSSRCLSRPEKGHLTSVIFSNDTTPSGDPPMIPYECNHKPDGETICLVCSIYAFMAVASC